MSVIVPARDAASTLPALLDALLAQVLPDGIAIEVLVADDGSTDGTADLAAAHPVGARVLPAPGRGPAAARNAAAAIASGEVLAFTDADCVPRPDWLARALHALDRGADLVQGSVGPPPDASPGPFDRTVHVPALSGLYETANLVVRRELFDRLGGFESWLGTRTAKELGEDAWFGWRAVRSGATVVFARDARVDHAVFPGTPGSFVRERTRLRFFPPLVARIPELRAHRCVAHWFLTQRTAEFDLAVLGVVAAASGGRSMRPLALLAVPYARRVARESRPWGRRLAPRVAVTAVAADAVGAAALVTGSIRARTVLL